MQDLFEAKMARARSMLAETLGVPELPVELHMRVTTPPLDECVRSFCRRVGIAEPMPVEIKPAEGAKPGCCFRNVQRHLERHGGSVRYGWIAWGAPAVYFESEFHAIWQPSDGPPLDITPQRDGEDHIIFSPALDMPADFDVTQRPPNKRLKVYRSPGLGKFTAEIAAMSESSLRYASQRAAAKGLSLDDWIASRIAGDPIDDAIDRFIELGDRMDAMMVPTAKGTVLGKGISSTEFGRVADNLLKAKLKLWTMVEGMVMRGMAEERAAPRL